MASSWRPSMDLEELRSMLTCNLPGDVMITHILPHLPVKTLVRNKVVNKTWYDLMENREFQEMHFNVSSPDQDDSFCVVQRELGVTKVYMVSPNQENVLCRKIDTVHGDRMCMIGSANGVICFTPDKEFGYIFRLHNPSYHRKYMELERKNRVVKGSVTLGFGYDSRNKDFKIVRIEQYMVSNQIHTICEIYSHNNDSWRIFEPKLELLAEETSSAYVNGALHWLAERGKPGIIISFDLSEEVFGEILLPSPYTRRQIHVWKDHLAAIYYYNNYDGTNYTEYLVIWMMTEYGIKESWSRVCMYGPFPSVIVVHGSTKNGELMLFNSDTKERLVMFNAENGESRHVEIEGFELSSSRLDVINYKESLIKVHNASQKFYLKLPYLVILFVCLVFGFVGAAIYVSAPF